jgi:hypothetical protein
MSTEEEPIPRWQEIAQLAVDDEATPAELSELQSFLDHSAEAREFHDSLRQLITELHMLPPIEPAMSVSVAVIAEVKAQIKSRQRIALSNERGLFHSGVIGKQFFNRLTKKGNQMSNDKRTRFLIGSGAVAIILLAVFVFVSPKIPPEKTTGAIGAVQKHHETQITAKDVVLGDEKTRVEQKVLYADYLADAAKLQNISADLAMAVNNRDQAAAKSSLDNVAKELANHQADLANRYAASMSQALAHASAYLDANASSLSAKQLAAARAELASISAAMANRQQLDSARMESMNTMLSHATAALQSMMASRNLDNAKSSLDNALAQLQAKGNLDNAALANMNAKLELASHELNVRSELASALANREAYMSALAMECKALDNAQVELASALAARSQLDNRALDNKQQLANTEIANKAVDNRALNSKQIDNISLELANHASQLESQALKNVQASLASHEAAAVELGQMTSTLELCSQALQSHSTSLESAALANLQKALSNISQQVANRSVALQAAAALNMKAELAAFGSQLDNREQLNNRLANKAELSNQMANQSRLASAPQLAARFANREVLVSMQNHLANLTKALDNRALASAALANRQELNSKAHELENRAAALANNTK